MLKGKQFIMAWGQNYEHGHRLIQDPETFFVKENGFSEWDIAEIDALDVAEAYRCDDIGTATVLRVEDKQE